MTGKNVQHKVLNESSIILSCFAAFNAISSTFLRSSNNWHRNSPAPEALNLCFIFRLIPFKANIVSHIAHSCLTTLHISHFIQPSTAPPPPPPTARSVQCSGKESPRLSINFYSTSCRSTLNDQLAGCVKESLNDCLITVWFAVCTSDIGLIAWLDEWLMSGYLVSDRVTDCVDIWYVTESLKAWTYDNCSANLLTVNIWYPTESLPACMSDIWLIHWHTDWLYIVSFTGWVNEYACWTNLPNRRFWPEQIRRIKSRLHSSLYATVLVTNKCCFDVITSLASL
jgi:hypothetical protein